MAKRKIEKEENWIDLKIEKSIFIFQAAWNFSSCFFCAREIVSNNEIFCFQNKKCFLFFRLPEKVLCLLF